MKKVNWDASPASIDHINMELDDNRHACYPAAPSWVNEPHILEMNAG